MTQRSSLIFRDPATPLSLEQRELRKQVYKQIDADPDTFDMSSWESSVDVTGARCGTTRCVAGWAQFFARGEVFPHDAVSVKQDAITLLGLTHDEYYCGGFVLFYTSNERALAWMKQLAGE